MKRKFKRDDYIDPKCVRVVVVVLVILYLFKYI